MKIRLAQPSDAPAIAEIYNHYVMHSTATYQEEPDTLEQRQAWLSNRKPEHVVLVGEENGVIIGWAALSEWKARSAYRYAAESSVYLRAGHTGRGLGKLLLEELIALARHNDMRTLIGVISAEQAPSIKLHQSLGFERVGTLSRVGYKFGGWLDIALLQLDLTI